MLTIVCKLTTTSTATLGTFEVLSEKLIVGLHTQNMCLIKNCLTNPTKSNKKKIEKNVNKQASLDLVKTRVFVQSEIIREWTS